MQTGYQEYPVLIPRGEFIPVGHTDCILTLFIAMTTFLVGTTQGRKVQLLG